MYAKISTPLQLSKSLIKLLDEEINDFYRRVKLKTHFRDNNKVKEQTEEEIINKSNQ